MAQLKRGERAIKKYTIYIGVDVGVSTGLAVWSKESGKGCFTSIETLAIHQAFERVKHYYTLYRDFGVVVVVEDARKRKFFRGEDMAAKQQGAGSVKRDSSIWEAFLEDLGVDYDLVMPRNTKMMDERTFKLVTKWPHRTSNHARDAAMLVFQS